MQSVNLNTASLPKPLNVMHTSVLQTYAQDVQN